MRLGLCGTEEMEEAEEEPKEWVDDGSLPLNKDGQLMFYFLDAHEDTNLPHTVYLFGKVVMIGDCTPFASWL